MSKIKIIRSTTVPRSLSTFCNGLLSKLSEKYEVIGLSSPGVDLDEVARREGVRTIAVPMKRRISLLQDFKSLLLLVKVFKKERPTMVHSITPKAGMLCMVAAWLTRVPIRLHTFTGLVFPTETGLKRKILMATDWLTCFCATHIVPEGEGVKNDLLSNGITKKQLKVLGYGNIRGVDMEYYSRRDVVINKMKDLGLRNNSVFTFAYVGRIVRDKGINELCQVMDKLSKLAPVRLFLVGNFEDDLNPISEKSREIINKNSSIEYVGPKYGNELLAYYAAADCFVFPSYREGFPNAVLEAGAMGLPSIVTDINGSREIIIPRENGVIIPSHDTDALFNAMLNMIRNKTEREKMAAKARDLIASRYEQDYVHKCLYDFYEDILKPFA